MFFACGYIKKIIKIVKSWFKRHIIFRFCQLFSSTKNDADVWMIQKFSSTLLLLLLSSLLLLIVIIIIIIIIIIKNITYSGTKINFYHCAYVYLKKNRLTNIVLYILWIMYVIFFIYCSENVHKRYVYHQSDLNPSHVISVLPLLWIWDFCHLYN